MKIAFFKIISIAIFLLLVPSSYILSADEQAIILSGEKLVDAWNRTFEKEVDYVRQFLSVENIFKSMPNDKWCVVRNKLIDGTLGYDIKKTDSLVSPYILIISFKIFANDNCGSQNANWDYDKKLNKMYGFKTAEDALNNTLPTDFYKGDTETNMRINYTFQKGKWVFKGGNDNFLWFWKFVLTNKENSKFMKLMAVE